MGKKYWLAALAGFVGLMVAGWVLDGWLLKGYFERT